MAIDSWRPDWTDSKSYPTPETAGAEQWAWEFLRRNQEYQDTFQQYAEFFKPDRFRSWFENLVWNFDHLRNYNLICQKFRVMHLVDPRRDYTQASEADGDLPALNFRIDFGWLLPYSTQMETEPRSGGIYCKNFVPPLPEKWGDVLVKFDLSVPLEIQFEQLKNSLADMQKTLFDENLISDYKWANNGSNALNNFADLQKYLRALDASESNKSDDEIAKALACNAPDAKKIIDSAKTYCKTDYYKLVVYSNNISDDNA
jgi:hypothetical protein